MPGQFTAALQDSDLVTVAVTGRVTGRQISNPVWFVQEDRDVFLLPVRGSDTSWFKNVRAIPSVRLTADGVSVSAHAEALTDHARTQAIVQKFQAKYGAQQIRQYYSKLDAAVQVSVGDEEAG